MFMAIIQILIKGLILVSAFWLLVMGFAKGLWLLLEEFDIFNKASYIELAVYSIMIALSCVLVYIFVLIA